MNNLVKNEIIKIVKKKSFYIILIVILAYIVLSNVMSKYVYTSVNSNYYTEEYINIIKEELKNLDPESSEDVDIYVSDKTDIETYELMKQYDKDSWQYALIQEKGKEYISEINEYTYKNKDNDALEKSKEELNKFQEKLKTNDWKVFAQEELDSLKQNKEILKEMGQEDKSQDFQIEVLEMRLKYNVEYGNNFKNNALLEYEQSKITINELEKTNNKTYEEELRYQKSKEIAEKDRYVIENNKDIFNTSNSRAFLLNVFSKYELFIIITIVLIGGAIVSDEFNKGTIKLLLVRPYSRIKILAAKFITVMITVIFTMIITVVLQFIVGGIFFGFDSISIPAVVYNYTTGKIMEMSIAKYILIIGLGKLPIYILMATLAFALSTLFNNTAVAITITLMGYMASSIINQIASYYEVKWLKFFVTPNWDFTQFLYGKLPLMKGLNVPFSIAICLIYFIIMLIPTILVFKKRNIKNI